jgi:molybdopterin-guanine dinucleotide biosynthesis protein A
VSAALALVVFAGGEGRRLGGLDKARLVDTAGRRRLTTVFERIGPSVLAPRLALMGDAAVVQAVVVTRPTRRAVHAALCPGDTTFVVDPGGGPARALAAALPALAAEWLWLVGVDQHALPPEALEAAWSRRVDADVVLPHADAYAQPLGALARRAALNTTPPRAGLRAWLESTGRVVGWSAPGAWFAGLDTPEALASAGWRAGEPDEDVAEAGGGPARDGRAR